MSSKRLANTSLIDAHALWEDFQQNFDRVLDLLPYHKRIVNAMKYGDNENQNNILLYGVHGFPLDVFARHIVYTLLHIHKDFDQTNKKVHIWENKVPYDDYGYFFQIDFNHPEMSKEVDCILEFIKTIIQTKSSFTSKRHVFILLNIDTILYHQYNNVLRVILERFSSNALFLACSYKYSKIEFPIRSRFENIRVPLIQPEEFNAIHSMLGWSKHFKPHVFMDHHRNLFKTLMSVHATSTSKSTLEMDLIKYFQQKSAHPSHITSVRNLAKTYFQHCISLASCIKILLNVIPNEHRYKFIHRVVPIEHQCKCMGKGREPLYYETVFMIAYFLHIL